MIEKPPKITMGLISSVAPKMANPEIALAVSELNYDYLYWDEIKYKDIAALTGKELWTAVKMSRMGLYALKWPEYGISIPVTNHMQELCHYFDMNFGGVWATDSILPKEGREVFLNSSVMEEAIASSQIEGASTTRKVAKDMLRRNISPRNRAEQMIHNNYSAIRYIAENNSSALSPEFILRIHEIMTENTLDNPEDAGRFRTNNDVVVADSIKGEVVHIPPSYSEISKFIEDLCAFANADGSYFIHPIIKAITIHFLVAYYHPFSDGNGRTARALFYWYMLKSGYWLMEYLSISRIISRAKPSYEKSFLYAEKDGNDIGYFISYNLRVLKLSFDELKNYIERKIIQKQRSFNLLTLGGINYRQAMVLSMFKDNPAMVLSVNNLVAKFNISKPTVYADINPLIKRRLLARISINNKQSDFVKGPDYDQVIGKLI
ncbi:MAG: Fic family protein [Bacteroidales bacterium]|nr:Fic family protein [Bacteroidales bacterium]